MFALRPPRPLRSTTVLLGTMRFTNICIVAAALTLAACATQPPVTYDLVIANGRVMDPESGLDAVRHVGIRGGTIEAVSATPLAGTRVIDAAEPRRRARLHRPARARAAGGVVPDDGARRRHLGVRARGRHRRRRRVVRGARRRADRQLRRVGRPHPGADEGARRSRHRACCRPASAAAAPRPTRRWRRWKRSCAKGSRRARWPMGFGSAYTPGAPMSEIERMFRVAGAGGASAHIHMRGGAGGLRETIAAAKAAGAPLHIVHVNSSAGDELDGFLAADQGGARRGAGRHDRGVSLRRRHDRDPVGALRRLARRWPDERFALHQLVSTRRAADARDVRQGA